MRGRRLGMRWYVLGGVAVAIIIVAVVLSLLAEDRSSAAPPSRATTAAPPPPPPLHYVALGDSYTSGPGIEPQVAGAPQGCGRSAVNYPNLVATALKLRLDDVSCGSATTADLDTAQHPDQPAQFSALTSAADVVSLGIGGNDNETFAGSLQKCILADLGGITGALAPCKLEHGSSLTKAVADDGPAVGAALARIRQLAPHAKVFVVGYPDILPQSGSCIRRMPISSGDVSFLNSLEKQLNSMLEQQAAAAGAVFVDTYTPTIGHDTCKADDVRWIEPLFDNGGATAVHPNAAGQRAMAGVVETAMRSAGIG